MNPRALLVTAALFALGCERVPTAPLLELSDVTPRRVELGDKLEIGGASLPEGRTARVVLRGTLHRPGEAPEDAEVDTTGRVVSRDRIEVPVTTELLGALCGEGRSAVHTTFSGAVDVIFAAQRPGAPPVSGAVETVELDAVPQGVRREDDEGVRALAAIGVHLAPADPELSDVPGLVVGNVDPGSRAERSGLGAGDRLLAFAGVRVLGPSDVGLPPGRATTTARVAHGSSSVEDEVTIAIDGVAPPARGHVSLGLALAASVAVALLALLGPLARGLAWAERRLGQGLTRQPSLRWPSRALLAAAALALPLGKALFAARVELGLVSVTVALAWLALGLSNARGPRAVGATVLEHLVHAVPVVAVLAVVGVRDGSLAASDVLRAQGAAPWDMTAARSPVGLLLLALLLAPWALPSRSNDGARALVPTAFACTVAATLLLGGWAYTDTSASHVSPIGAALFLAKTGALYWVVSWVRRSLPPVDLGAWVRVVWPLAFAAVVVESLGQRWAISPVAGSVSGLAALALLGFVLLRASRIARSEVPRAHADALL